MLKCSRIEWKFLSENINKMYSIGNFVKIGAILNKFIIVLNQIVYVVVIPKTLKMWKIGIVMKKLNNWSCHLGVCKIQFVASSEYVAHECQGTTFWNILNHTANISITSVLGLKCIHNKDTPLLSLYKKLASFDSLWSNHITLKLKSCNSIIWMSWTFCHTLTVRMWAYTRIEHMFFIDKQVSKLITCLK